MAFTIDRCCVACRKMIPSETGNELLAIVDVTTEYKEKTGKLNAKIKAGVIDALCPNCAEKLKGIVKGQKEKGYKPL